MPVTAILAGALIDNYGWLASELNNCDFIICADSGLRHAEAVNVMPDLITGDFDSVDSTLLTSYEGQCNIIHDPDQNRTDLMKALSNVPDNHEIHVYGAVGERADHDFSNYLILLNLKESNHIILKTEKDERRVITRPLTLHAEIGDMVGVFPLLPVGNLSYKGLAYPAEVLGCPYELGWNGSCNPAIATIIEINIDSGAALVTHSLKSQ